MKRLPFVLVAALGLALVGCGPKKEEAPPMPKVAAQLRDLGAAPAWQLKDLDGKVVSSDQFKGRVVVIDFWATWCAPCRVEIPGYIEMTRKYGPDGLTIIGVSMDEAGVDVVKDFVAKSKMNYPVLMFDEKIFEAFGGHEAIPAIPTTFLIDRSGQVRHKKVGAEASASYERKVLELLKEPVGNR